MVGRSFAVIEWGKRQVVDSVTDLKRSWVVVGQVDATQRNAPLKSGESNLIHWSDRMAAVDGKKKQYAVEMYQEGLLGNSPGTISRRGL